MSEKHPPNKPDDNEENSTLWLPIGLCMGTSLGLLFGTLLDNLTMGLCLGPGLGLLLGTVLDAAQRKKK